MSKPTGRTRVRDLKRPSGPGVRDEKSIRCLSRYENGRERGFRCIAGVDEVGRGALFGPVFAAAVVLDPGAHHPGLRDSKILDAERESPPADEIKRKCVAWAVGAADAFEIDQINIYQASRLAMKRAMEALGRSARFSADRRVKVDLPIHQQPLIDGDARCRAIAAASIIAKVARDECMNRWHTLFPAYNLASNKGYSTPDHKRALRNQGPTSLHRFSFRAGAA